MFCKILDLFDLSWILSVPYNRTRTPLKGFNFKGQCAYVESCLQSNDINLYGIFDDTTHIGNIVISGLNSRHRLAELTYVIGETNYWGKGIASFAIAKMIKVAKADFNLNKLSNSSERF